MRRWKPFKKKNTRQHSQTRALQRYDIWVESRTRQKIKGMVMSNQSKFIRRVSNTCTIHEVEVDGQTMRLVWNKERSDIVTFLPLETNGEKVY
jgi:hypothetical protein